MHKDSVVHAIKWDDGQLLLLDQRVLPETVTYLPVTSVADVTHAITDMVVRGAPAIGIAAAYGVVMAARERFRRHAGQWQAHLGEDLDKLRASRPTAVNLAWAIDEMSARIQTIEGDPEPALRQLAQKIHREDIENNRKMGQLGAALIAPESSVLTHCNAGALATGGWGTALGVIRSAASKLACVYADETRPWLQGARLTAWELMQDQIPVTLIVDSAAGYLMQQQKIQWVIVGSDRIVANGDIANKIGTYNTAVLAKHHGVKFMVVAPTSTIDVSLADGSEIPIETRSESEVSDYVAKQSRGQVWNPVFDVTPASFVDVLVTEKGVLHHPNKEKIQTLFKHPR